MKDNVHLIFGPDEYFVDLRAKKRLADYAEFSLETIQGTMNTIADLKQILENVIESLRTMDFFSSQKCVWLRSTTLLGSGSPATTEGGQPYVDRWLAIVKSLPAEVQLVISASPVDKRTRLFKTLQDLAVCEELEDKNAGEYLRSLVKKLSKELKVEISADAFELLVQKMNHQPRAIANEFEKLSCLKNFTGCIQVDEVLACTPTLLNDEFFEPVEAFYEKNKACYVRSLRNHFTLNKEMRSVLVMMQNRNRLLIQLEALHLPSMSKAALEEQYDTYAADFGPIKDKNTFCVFSQNPWYLSRLKSPFPLQTLLDIQQELVAIFDRILQSPQKACAWMESLIRFF